MKIKLKEWAKDNGISYKTALKQFKNGTLDGKTYESDTGRKFVVVDYTLLNKIDASIKILEEVKTELKKR